MVNNILIVRKMSSLEYYYNGSHKSPELKASQKESSRNLAKVEKMLKDAGQNYCIITRKELTRELVGKYDFVFSMGGDGTVIAAAAFNEKTPQLNLKTDRRSKGKLCMENLEQAVKAVLNENYRTEKWTRQDVYLDKALIGRALNEVCVGEQLKFSKMGKYEIMFLDKRGKVRKDKQANSGLIIATGTGSTGWPAAFKPYSRGSKLFRFNTLMPHEQTINKGEGSYFKVTYRYHQGKFAIDTIEHDFPRDSVLEIKLSEKSLKVIIPE